MKRQFRGVTIAGIVAITMMLISPANAALSVQVGFLTTGATVTGGVICVDNTACDTNPAVGILTWVNVATGTSFTIQGTTATSGSPVGALSMTLNGVPTTPATFMIAVSDTNFNTPPPPLTIVQDVSGLAAPGGPSANLSAVGFFNGSNVLFGTGTSTPTATAVTNGPAGVTTSGVAPSGNPYSLTELVTVDITSVGTGLNRNLQVNADLTVAAVPEPTSLALLGGALLLSAGAIRRRVRRQA
jgi:hypothetical protein